MKLLKRIITAIIIVPAGAIAICGLILSLCMHAIWWVVTAIPIPEFSKYDAFMENIADKYINWLNK